MNSGLRSSAASTSAQLLRDRRVLGELQVVLGLRRLVARRDVAVHPLRALEEGAAAAACFGTDLCLM